MAPATESEFCGSPPIKDDWEKVDMQGAEEGPALSTHNNSPPAAAPEEPLEAFQDAIETKPQQGTKPSAGSGVNEPGSERSGQAAAVERSSSRPSAAVAVGKVTTTVIAAGLANVRLPMGYDRQARLGGPPADSDGEEEFHDAHDSGPGMAKDAIKAREMKEIGNE